MAIWKTCAYVISRFFLGEVQDKPGLPVSTLMSADGFDCFVSCLRACFLTLVQSVDHGLNCYLLCDNYSSK